MSTADQSTQQPATGSLKGSGQYNVKQFIGKYGIYMVLVVMVIAMSFLSPVFMSQDNLLNIVRQVAVVGTISLGVTLVIISKGIDLSSGSTLALAAVMAASVGQVGDWGAKMYPSLPEMPVIVPIIAALGIGTLVGAVNGLLVAKTGIPAFIATLGTYVSVRGLALLYSDGRPVSTLTPSYQFIGQGYVFGIPVPVIIFLSLAFVTWVILNHTKFGKNIYAIGGNIVAAEVSGVNVQRNLVKIYMYAGMLAGVAGWFCRHALTPDSRAWVSPMNSMPSPRQRSAVPATRAGSVRFRAPSSAR